MQDIDFEAVSVGNAEQLQNTALQQKEQKKLKIKSALKPVKEPKAKATKPLGATEVKQFAKIQADAMTEEEKPMLEKAFRKYNRLCKRFPEHIPKEPKIKNNSTLDDVQIAIKLINSNICSENSVNGAKALLNRLAGGVEYITMRKGYNPLELNLHGFGDAIAAELKKPEEKCKLEPEVSLAAIELEDWLALPWWANLMHKFMDKAEEVHEQNMGRGHAEGAHRVPEVVINEFKDL